MNNQEEKWKEVLKSISSSSLLKKQFIENLTASMVRLGEVAAKQTTEAVTRSTRKFREAQAKYFDELSKSVKKSLEEISQHLEKGVSNFEEPDKYDRNAVKIDRIVVDWAKNESRKLLKEMPKLLPHFEERFKKALLRYRKETDDYLPIYVFLSLQDGIMAKLCILDTILPKGKNGTYLYYQKFDCVISNYGNVSYLVGKKNFYKNLRNFFNHRHEIMHGGINAHFDYNIATISLLFLILTFHVFEKKVIEKSP